MMKLPHLEQSITVFLADKIRSLEANNERVIKLQTGDPDFATPQPIIDAAHQAMLEGHTHYSNSRGLLELRTAIADQIKRESNLVYDPNNEVQITHGGVHGLFVTLNALVGQGDEVLILDPSWMPYISSTIVAGATPVRISSSRHDGFKIDFEQIEQHITNRTRILIINSPCNPTGQVLCREELEILACIVEKNNLLVISDEVYEKLVYDDAEHIRFASLPGMQARTITINSLSKTYAMSGWRVGYLSATLTLMDQIMKVAQYSITHIAPFVQKAALVALIDPQVQECVEEMRQMYDLRRKRIAEIIEPMDGVFAPMPQGAFYYLVDFSSRCMDSIAFSEELLERESVGVVPGVGFGECAEGTVRITYAVDSVQIEEGLQRFLSMLEKRF
jgi:aspartate/methionine/tyrosine aminotransferase